MNNTTSFVPVFIVAASIRYFSRPACIIRSEVKQQAYSRITVV